eukprot:TRINITY_DN10094_c0_g1_i1.p1 TRINITY_DN10094_c0_g1~~TRINITY_DN10094_c0_g1_i1.p1  ORF type:complete len:342 (+),score=101.31 TRINITY_DN10094_c0_g1_i1:41-1066(+)
MEEYQSEIKQIRNIIGASFIDDYIIREVLFNNNGNISAATDFLMCLVNPTHKSATTTSEWLNDESSSFETIPQTADNHVDSFDSFSSLEYSEESSDIDMENLISNSFQLMKRTPTRSNNQNTDTRSPYSIPAPVAPKIVDRDNLENTNTTNLTEQAMTDEEFAKLCQQEEENNLMRSYMTAAVNYNETDPDLEFARRLQLQLAAESEIRSMQQETDTDVVIDGVPQEFIDFAMSGMYVEEEEYDEEYEGDLDDYEANLELAALIGDVNVGANDDDLAKMEVIVFGNELELKHESCNICLCEWEEADSLKILECGHIYHDDCIDTWLKKRKTCPTCKAEVSF